MLSKHIVITGPESSGKTTLTHYLTSHYKACCVPEIARDFLEQLDQPYTQTDVVHMASLQFKAQLEGINCPLVFSDTSLLNYLIWMEVKYGYVDPQVEEWFHLQNIDAYLLLVPDLPWEPDPLRENPTMLNELFDLFYKKIEVSNVPFFIIKGQDNQRNIHALQAVDSLLKN